MSWTACTWTILTGSAVTGLAILPVSLVAAPPSRVTAGLQLAQKYCAECHQVEPSRTTSWTDAPDFQVIADRPLTSVRKLDAFIQKPHMKMLNTERPPAEANAIAAYIMSLRRGSRSP
jgi:mono/diheme cytochrome c family protein